MLTLAIETSCDETSVAVIKNGRDVLSNTISSQIEIHKRFGGVVPEVASRKHLESINKIIETSLKEAQITLDDVDNIGVTYGPGLVGALLVGISSAKALAFAKKKPLIPVNHIEGHIFANFIEHKDLEPPFTCLIVSGGHTHLVYMKDYGEYELLGRTRDDAAGEAFDKVARVLGLPYPGGPVIDELAKTGDSKAIRFPRAYLEEGTYDFSFSGLKTSVLNYINSSKQKNIEMNLNDVSASFQAAVVEVLVEKTVRAAKEKGSKIVTIAGGVASNEGLRQALIERCKKEGLDFKYPSKILCTDNAAMVGSVAYYNFKRGKVAGLDLNAVPNDNIFKNK